MVPYKGKRLAEWLETALCICPRCGGIGTLKSQKDQFSCTCGLTVRYGQYGFFEGENVPFASVSQWDAWQSEQLAKLAQTAGDAPLFSDREMVLYAIDDRHGVTVAAQGDLWMNEAVLAIGAKRFDLAKIPQLSIVRQCHMVFATGGAYYEIRAAHPWNARKYVLVHDLLRARKTAR